jgi:hypothetical protein
LSRRLPGGQGRAGNTCPDDAEAESRVNSSNQAFFQQIIPGNEVKGVLIFDIPEDGRTVTVDLRDSPLSAGVIVSVGWGGFDRWPGT